jgi:hypothetical protein
MRLFSKEEIKIIALVVSGATAVALVITITTGLARNRNQPAPREEYTEVTELPFSAELVIPEEFTLTGGERWYFSREPLKAWSEEQLDMYWIDPTEISIDLLEGETDRIIREFADELP